MDKVKKNSNCVQKAGMFTICPYVEYTMSLSNSTKATIKTPNKFTFTQSCLCRHKLPEPKLHILWANVKIILLCSGFLWKADGKSAGQEINR
jgi:hypothetical protein